MIAPAQTPMWYSLQLAQESSYEYSRRNTLSFFDGFYITIIHRGNFSEKTIKMANNVYSILMGWINIQLSIF